MENKKIAIIPARGGSKRIPRKNIIPFQGKPMLAYAINAAIKSELFDEIIVSTDDKEIAEIAEKHGAKVPFLRSAKNSNDFATTYNVLAEVFDFYEENGVKFDTACCIYPCVPLLNSDRIKEAEKLLYAGDYDVVFPVIEYGTPIARAFKISDNSKIEPYFKENLLERTQDVTSSYFDAGQFYWMDVLKVRTLKKLITDNSGCIVLSELEAQDIDTLEDLVMAELKYKKLYA